MYLKRDVEESLIKALKQFPACLITGPRQAGKSTLLQHALPDHAYVTFDDLETRADAKNDPKLFFRKYPSPLIIDEIQYVPEVLSYIKMMIDQDRHNMGQFVLTGSQSFQVMKGVSESLAGRIAIFDLYPFTWNELKPLPDAQSALTDERRLVESLFSGFYPEVHITPDLDLNFWFDAYLRTYVERDIHQIKAISDHHAFLKFVKLLAIRAGQPLNLSEIAKEAAISHTTARSWVSVLESSYIIYLLQPYHVNDSKRLVKSPKLYFYDVGLLCYLLGFQTPDQLWKSPSIGSIFENMVITDAIKRHRNLNQRSEFFFYRTHNGLEVDLLIRKGTDMYAYEIKFAKTLHTRMAKSLTKFLQDFPDAEATLLSLAAESGPTLITHNVKSAHWSTLIL